MKAPCGKCGEWGHSDEPCSHCGYCNACRRSTEQRGSSRTHATARTKLRKRLRDRGVAPEEIERQVEALRRRQHGEPEVESTPLAPPVRTCSNAFGSAKRSWDSKRSALAALAGMTGRSERGTSMLVPYLCPSCSRWHLGNTRPGVGRPRP